jgi:hypothetical protein
MNTNFKEKLIEYLKQAVQEYEQEIKEATFHV